MVAPTVSSPNSALRREVVILNPQGLHLRPATAFAKLARQFHSKVFVCHEDQKVNGKSQMELLLLAAPQGSTVIVEVDGPDAAQALTLLAEILAAEGLEESD